MLKVDSLILLVNSLTKGERKSFKINHKLSDYMDLFDIIEANKNVSSTDLRLIFMEKKPKTNFDIVVGYLYKLVLEDLLYLREKQDEEAILLAQVTKARILFDKSMYEEALDMLQEVKVKAKKLENDYVFLYASRLELEYLLFLDFPNVSETELLGKHLKINDSLKTLRRMNEQLVLYELMKHRVLYKDNIRSKRQKDAFNDLVISEMSIVGSSKANTFEIKKLHQLFQSAYLISVGDYKSALHSYYELNNLFECNKQHWANPPVYYLMVLEGILGSLRGIREYDSMSYFIEKLEKFDYPVANFQANVSSIIFLYKLFPLLDKGDFQAAKRMVDEHKESVLSKMHLLSLNRQSEISLYISLIHIGLRDLKQAHKALLKVFIQSKNYYYLPLYRTIRLVNLMIQYETKQLDDFEYEIRSIKREISKVDKAYRVEHIMLKFFRQQGKDLFFSQREKSWLKMAPELEDMRNDVFEMQILKLFDFTAWIESKTLKTPLTEVLQQRFQ